MAPLPPLPINPALPPLQPLALVQVSAVQLYPLPMRMPALGASSVPLPMKMRTRFRNGPDDSEPVAEAAGESTPAAAGPTSSPEPAGSPLVTVAAGLLAEPELPISRRLYAATVHMSGAAAGESPFLPAPSQESRLPPSPLTRPGSALADGTVITGADASAGPTALTAAGLA